MMLPDDRQFASSNGMGEVLREALHATENRVIFAPEVAGIWASGPSLMAIGNHNEQIMQCHESNKGDNSVEEIRRVERFRHSM